MILNCGLDDWVTNSEVIRATSQHPEGPYEFQEVVVPVWAHDANALQAGDTGNVVLFVTALRGKTPRNCTTNEQQNLQAHIVNDTTTTPPPTTSHHPPPSKPPPTTAPPKDSYMLWAPTPEGPWSDPVLVVNSTIWNSDYWAKYNRIATCDTNLNGILLEDGSFVGLWRKCETPDLHTIPHRLTARNWKDPSTYEPHLEPLFVLGGAGAEDPSNIWTTNTSDMGTAYHVLFHDEQATRCMLPTGYSGNGRHAFSLDGVSWRYASKDAYNRTVDFSDGTQWNVTGARARPHVLLDSHNQLVALSTGFQARQDSGYAWTAVQAVRRSVELRKETE